MLFGKGPDRPDARGTCSGHMLGAIRERTRGMHFGQTLLGQTLLASNPGSHSGHALQACTSDMQARKALQAHSGHMHFGRSLRACIPARIRRTKIRRVGPEIGKGPASELRRDEKLFWHIFVQFREPAGSTSSPGVWASGACPLCVPRVRTCPFDALLFFRGVRSFTAHIDALAFNKSM